MSVSTSPMELATPAEQKAMIAKRTEMLKFFSDMEENIKKKLERSQEEEEEAIPDSDQQLFVDSDDSSTRGDDNNANDNGEDSSYHMTNSNADAAEQFYTLDEKDNMTLVVDEKDNNYNCRIGKSTTTTTSTSTTTLKSSSIHFGS
eukprot:gene3581-4887_t